jgi:vacuolar-type H+-ATPase subunit H
MLSFFKTKSQVRNAEEHAESIIRFAEKKAEEIIQNANKLASIMVPLNL